MTRDAAGEPIPFERTTCPLRFALRLLAVATVPAGAIFVLLNIIGGP